MSVEGFHPAVRSWFAETLGEPTPPQEQGWRAIREGRHTLIAAPTGSGKTLAAFLHSIDELVRLGLAGELREETHVLYVSPLKALSNDIEKNLRVPLNGIRERLRANGQAPPEIRVQVRTGDTPSSERAKMTRRPPHIFVTTPESLYILLTSEGGRRILRSVRTVIVDEIHAIADDKRGSHLSLSLERLAELVANPPDDGADPTLFPRPAESRRLTRIGLSATQRPIERVACFLVGTEAVDASGQPDCEIIDTGHRREMDLTLELTDSPLESVMSGEAWDEIYDRLAELIRAHKSTLVFVNTRRLSERVTARLSDRIGEEHVTSHHGSLSKEHRLQAEQRLKAGSLKALVATASLELGIDIGDVDLVCQIGSPRSIATLLQRVGRAGHAVRAIPKGRLFPLSRDELVECTALLYAIRRGELDALCVPEGPIDILAQQIVAATAMEEWSEDDLYRMARRAWPYRALPRDVFDAVVRMLGDGFSTRRGRRGARVHRDAVNKRVRGRRGARIAALTSGGAIPDNADYAVLLEPGEIRVGSVNEDFAIESMPGDIFQLGNTSWRILRVQPGIVRVEDAKGEPPTLPFWLGEAPGRTHEASIAVSQIREHIAARLPDGPGDTEPARNWIMEETGIHEEAARQLVEYLHAAHAALGVLPTQDTLVTERFFDESGGMQLIVHAPFGSRMNRAWGLALRKRFCQSFNFELQAAATEDAIILSLGPTHSFPLEDVFKFLHSATVREVLVQAMLDAPMFPTRWRWNASRALAILRWRGGKRVAPALQRMNADDLLAVVFPDSLACFENIQGGKREIPDHPLVNQTIEDCLHEAMDIDALEALLKSLERQEKTLVARDLREPSPLAQEILNARPYAFLDDAPLEERRTQAVISRRWMDVETASELGQLDAAAVSRVQEETWPDVRNPDELHEALLLLGFLTEAEGERGALDGGGGWSEHFTALGGSRRAAVVTCETGARLWVAAERLPQIELVAGVVSTRPTLVVPEEYRREAGDAAAALVEIVRGRLEGCGPITVASLAAALSIPPERIEAAMLTLEAEGFVFRGRFTPGTTEEEWCERRLLARIHRYTLQRLRKEIEPVTAADYMRFLFAWQHAAENDRMEGPDSLAVLLEQLEGFEAAGAAWEGEILPVRMRIYDPAWLDNLCLSGRIAWGRLTGRDSTTRTGPIRTTPLSFIRRTRLAHWRPLAPKSSVTRATLSSPARAVHEHLENNGASFFSEIVEATRLLRSQAENALGELVARGLVTADSFTGLRALLMPNHKRGAARRGERRPATAIFEIENAGRWALFAPLRDDDEETPPPAESSRPAARRQFRFWNRYDADTVERAARAFLLRYGIVFRRVLERERLTPGWGELLRVYRRMEARGEIRGGRFVNGFAGEQFALPEAVGLARDIRRRGARGDLVAVSGADPLNLTGIITPGERIAATLTNQILYQDGRPVAVQENGATRLLVRDADLSHEEIETVLVRRPIPAKLRQYL